jgi:serine/threonine protein kinase
MLFNPQKDKRFNTNRTHIHQMITILGKIPEEILEKSKHRVDFFKVNGQLKGDVPEIKYIPLWQLLRESLKDRPGYNDNNLFTITDLIYKLLDYDPNKRPSAIETLAHPFFA